jgi:tetratricopeptide (TPR) repeat protein/predicted aspartyl protease
MSALTAWFASLPAWSTLLKLGGKHGGSADTNNERRGGRIVRVVRHLGGIAAVATFSLSTAVAAGAPSRCHLTRSPPIPVTMLGWRPTVPVELDGNKTRLLVDTGAFFDMLSPAEAAQFKLPLSSPPFGLYVAGGLGNLEPQVATVKSFALGPIALPGPAIFLVGANDLGDGIAGVLGENLYRVLDVEFDFADGMMRLIQPAHCSGQILAYWAIRTGQSVSILNLEPRNAAWPHLLGTVRVNGHRIRAIFDTGATTSFLSLAAARIVGVSPSSRGVVAVGTSGKMWSAPIAEIQIGDNERVEHTRMLVRDYDVSFGPGMWMFIGADFFLSHRVYLATSQSKLYFTYNGGPVFDLNPAHASITALDHAASQPLAPTAAAAPNSAAPAGTTADADGLMRRGVADANRLEFQQALAELTQACRLAPRDADYRYQRGVVFWRDDQPDLALRDFDAAVELDPNDFRARLWRAEVRLLIHMGREPDPKSDTDPRIGLSSLDRPAPGAARNHAATVMDLTDDTQVVEDSKADLDAVDRLAPSEGDLRLMLGRVYEDIGQYAQAIHQYDLWITYHPLDYRVAMALTWRCGSRAWANANLDQALKDCNKAYRLMGLSWWSSRPKWPASWAAPLLSTRSLVELRQSNLKRAIADDDAAIKREPGEAYALYTRGLAELREGSTSQGQADLAAARRLEPGIEKRYTSVGLAP